MQSSASLPGTKSVHRARAGSDALLRGVPRLPSSTDDAAHYLDDERQEALRQVDAAPFGGFHTRVVIVAGVGFMAEAYAPQSIAK
jgi:hypothetical protein